MQGDLPPACPQKKPLTKDVESGVEMTEADEVSAPTRPLVCEDVLMDTPASQERNVGGALPFVASVVVQVCSTLCFFFVFFFVLLSCFPIFMFMCLFR